MAFELKWDRFVSTQGKIDTNIELDRHLEHLNKYVKTDLKQFQEKITDKSVQTLLLVLFQNTKKIERKNTKNHGSN